MDQIPTNYQPLEAGGRRAMVRVRVDVAADLCEPTSLTARARGRQDATQLSELEEWFATQTRKNRGINRADHSAHGEDPARPDPYYATRPGWDACTDWESVNGGAPVAAPHGGAAINEVDRTTTTPAVCVFDNMLYLFWKANDPFDYAYYSGSSDGLRWPNGKLLDAIDGTSDPLAAVPFNNDIYLFWKASDPSGSIYYSSFLDPASRKINDFDSTQLGLTACIQNGQVYLFWKANDPDNAINYSANEDLSKPWHESNKAGFGYVLGGKWKFFPFVTAFAPAVVNAPNDEMVLFWTANDDGQGSIYTSDLRQNPLTANNYFTVAPGANAQSGPAACLFKENMYAFWTASNTIFYSVSIDGTWSAPAKLNPGFQTTQAPAACVFNNLLYIFWTDQTTRELRFSASSDGLTWL